MYIGKTVRQTLQQRFKDYFREKDKPVGRPLILDLLYDYQGYVHFCCSVIGQKERIGEIENALVKALLPPCNDQFPAGVRRTFKGFLMKSNNELTLPALRAHMGDWMYYVTFLQMERNRQTS